MRLESQGLVADYGYELPMSQEQLGDATGFMPVHVNRTLKALESEGWIERDRRRIWFPHWAALQRMAGFSSLYLHPGRQAAASSNA